MSAVANQGGRIIKTYMLILQAIERVSSHILQTTPYEGTAQDDRYTAAATKAVKKGKKGKQTSEESDSDAYGSDGEESESEKTGAIHGGRRTIRVSNEQ